MLTLRKKPNIRGVHKSQLRRSHGGFVLVAEDESYFLQSSMLRPWPIVALDNEHVATIARSRNGKVWVKSKVHATTKAVVPSSRLKLILFALALVALATLGLVATYFFQTAVPAITTSATSLAARGNNSQPYQANELSFCSETLPDLSKARLLLKDGGFESTDGIEVGGIRWVSINVPCSSTTQQVNLTFSLRNGEWLLTKIAR